MNKILTELGELLRDIKRKSLQVPPKTLEALVAYRGE